MPKENLKVLSTESVEYLRQYLPNHPGELNDFDKSRAEALQLHLIETPYTIDTSAPSLLLPEGRDQASLKDTENCLIIQKILENLLPAEATDERIWVTLSLLHFGNYALKRWPIAGADSPKKHIINHWFANGSRPRMRDNAISRLWWMGHIASKIPGNTMEEVFEILFFNSDYRSSLLERNSSANSINVTASILEITKEAYKTGVPFNRAHFRRFMKEVDLIGGRTILAAMTREDLIALLKPVYQRCYGI